MSTETQAGGNGATSPTGAQTLTVTDNRTGQTYELPITDGTIRGMDLRQIKIDDDGLRPDVLRPGVHEHRVVPVGASRTSTATRASSSTAATRSSSSPSSRPTSRSPTCSSTASCRPQAELESWIDEITTHTFVHENVKGFMQGFRYDAHPMGMLLGVRRRALDLLPGREGHQRPREPRAPRRSG